MTHCIRKYRAHVVNITFIALIGTLSVSAYAQENSEIVNCKEHQDKATRTQAELCSAHPGCSMVLKLQKDCAKMEGFLSRLKGHLSGRKEITNNDVFEANTPRLTSSEPLKAKVSAVQKIIRDNRNAPNQGIYTGKNAAGADIYYEGGIKDGEMHGVGVYINSDGTMTRGQVINGRFEGQAQAGMLNGAILVGDFVGGKLQGNIATQAAGGAVLAGYKGSDKKWSGVVDFTQRNGDHRKVLYSSEGIILAEGPVVKEGQKAPIPSAPKQNPQQHEDAKALARLQSECVNQVLAWTMESLKEDIARPGNSLENSIRHNQRVIELYEGRCASTPEAKQAIADAKATISTNQIDQYSAGLQAGIDAQSAENAKAKQERDARSAAETSEAVGQLLGTVGQIQQNKIDRKQAQIEEQQRQQQAQQEQQRRAYAAEAAQAGAFNRQAALKVEQQITTAGNASSSGPKDPGRTRKVHNPAADAKDCVQLIQDSARQGAGTSGNWRFANNCNGTVEIFWCFMQNDGSCREGGTWTVHAGKGWPTFNSKPIKWGACRGRDGGGMDNDSNGGRYTCHLLQW